jgi:hypothetical protein
MKFQEQKHFLEKYLDGRLISDAVFYRVRRELKDIGFTEIDYPAIFPLLVIFNSGKRALAVPPKNYFTVYQDYKDSKAVMTCEQFQIWLEKGMTHKPKSRLVKGKIYLSPTWYRWFVLAGIPWEKETVYPFEKYLIVAAQAAVWDYKKQIKTAVDANVVNPAVGQSHAA